MLSQIEYILKLLSSDYDAIEQMKIYFNVGAENQPVYKDYVIRKPLLEKLDRKFVEKKNFNNAE